MLTVLDNMIAIHCLRVMLCGGGFGHSLCGCISSAFSTAPFGPKIGGSLLVIKREFRVFIYPALFLSKGVNDAKEAHV